MTQNDVQICVVLPVLFFVAVDIIALKLILIKGYVFFLSKIEYLYSTK